MTFTPLSVTGRHDRLRDGLAHVDALILTDLTNIRWFTGFTGSNALVVIRPDDVVIITDGRYGEQATQQADRAGCPARVIIGRTGAEMDDALGRELAGVDRIGFESAHTSHARASQLEQRFPSQLVPTVGVVERGRRTKDRIEIERIEHACSLADEALAAIAPTIRPGVRETEVRNQLESLMRELGADGPSYETIVAAGPDHGALPHHRPTTRALEPGDTLIIDVGALVDGYHSDMTRSWVVGQPSRRQQEVYDAVLAAQLAGLAAVRPGTPASAIDAACRDVLRDAGLEDWFTHGTGHGVGLLIHEDPFVNSAATWHLQVGDVVTVEPGAYRGGFGGFRVEDLVEVTSTGCRTLTRSPKDVPCLPSPPTT